MPKALNTIITKLRKRIETPFIQLVEISAATNIKAESYHGFINRINLKILTPTTALYFKN